MTDPSSPRRSLPNRWIISLLLVASLLSVVVFAAAANPNTGPIGLGDEVTYHFTVYDENDEALYTTDGDLAQAQLASGNPFVEPNLTASTYAPCRGIIADTPLDLPDANYTESHPAATSSDTTRATSEARE